MSVNKDRAHVIVLPEDDANRQLANGFHLHPLLIRPRQMQVLQPAGGRSRVLDLFVAELAPEMKRNGHRLVVLLIDFDGTVSWVNVAKGRIPPDLADRVFLLGSLTRPEQLRQAGLGSYEDIGQAMARDCCGGTDEIWSHALLQHNMNEIGRLRIHVRPILF